MKSLTCLIGVVSGLFFTSAQAQSVDSFTRLNEIPLLEDDDVGLSYMPTYGSDGTTVIGVRVVGYSGSEKEVVIPSEPFGGVFGAAVDTIALYAFDNNQTIESVVIPEGVIIIEACAFHGCTNLKKVVLPKSLEKIEGYAFYDCKNLEEINLENKLELIGEGAFMRCSKLNALIVPESLQFLGRNSFFDCPDLWHIYFKGNAPYVPTLDFPVTDPSWSWNTPSSVFGASPAITHVHYLEGTTGWKETPQTWVHAPWAYLDTWTLPANEPEVFVPQKMVKDGKVEMTLVFGGTLQSSTNLKDWEPIETVSPYLVSVPTADKKFYRAVSSE